MSRNATAKNITILDLPKSVTSDTFFRECYQAARAYNKLLTEGKALTPDEIKSIFQSAEEMKTDAGTNRTLTGQAGQALSSIGAKIKQLAGVLQDTTPVRGIDSIYDSLKQKASQSMGTSPGSAGVLRSIDHYRQLARKYPTTQKFFWGAAMVLTGIFTGGATLPVILGSIKAIDAMVQGDRFSTAIGKGAATGAGAYGIHKAIDATSAGIHGAQDLAHNAQDAYNNWHPFDAHAQTNPPSVTPPAPNTPPSVTPPAPGSEAYTTVGGDQLGKIAQAHNTTTQAIIDANPNVASSLKAAMNGRDMPIGLKMNIPTGGTGGNPFAGNKFFPLKEAIEKIYTPVLLPMSEMVDKETTVRKWALNESLGRARGHSVELTEAGVATVFYNVDRLDGLLHEAFDPEVDEARRNNYGRETSTAMGRQAGRTGQTAQQFATANPQAAAAIRTANPTSNDYRMQQPDDTLAAKAPGSNATAAPAAPTAPAAPPETGYKGKVGNGPMDWIEDKLKKAGNYIGDRWKYSTTRVNKERLNSMWIEAGEPTDSDEIADLLVKAKLDPQFIEAIYAKMKLPKPPALEPANKSRSTGFHNADIYKDAEQGNFSKVSDEELKQLIDNPTPEIKPETLQAMKDELARRSQGGQAQGSQAQGSGQQSQPNTPQQQQAVARTVRQQIDDIMHTIMTQHNDDQPALVKYLRQRLDQNFPAAATAEPAAKPAEAPASASGEVDPHSVPYDAVPPVTRTTSSDISPASNTTPVRKVAERRQNRVYGGRYVKESADRRLAREFEQFVNTLG